MQTEDERMKQIVAEVAETVAEVSQGVCCECGGIMRYNGNQQLVLNDPKDMSKGFHDELELACDRCGKKSKFIKQTKQLNEQFKKKE